MRENRAMFHIAAGLAKADERVLTSPKEDLEQLPPSLPKRAHAPDQRTKALGKFIYAGSEKLWVRGVTYGTFRPGADGCDYPNPAVVRKDFSLIASSGMNTVRTYTVPPMWLLEAAKEHGLYVMVGIPWEQHIAFLDDSERVEAIKRRVRDAVIGCAAHPAVLCFAVGNEIPPSIVRWHGRQRIENFIRELYDIVKNADPGSLVTYVNFPTTEYLQLPFLDIVCFNVYLEAKGHLESYIARIQNIAGERPLIMAEIGLDSLRNGDDVQAKSLDWQVRSAFASGCAGAIVFAWTDEWHRGGCDIDDWNFGLTTRERDPKPSLFSVSRAFHEVPFPPETAWPRISVVVCSYNGSRTIRDTLQGLSRLDYPDYEVIVVNDGSRDSTPAIAREFDVRLISTENRGLSNARNTGWQEATGEIVAYIDDDAYPDKDWLTYIAHTFLSTSFMGVGGPNIAPPDNGIFTNSVVHAPGGPVHVLLSDRVAEHIAGCNMAFRREALSAIGGFDPRFRTAGDDVDICWKIQERGWKIGFNAAAVVWHYRRGSLKTYWKQQRGYGQAEALLEQKWPQKYNAAGHITWTGRLYGKGLSQPIKTGKWRIYHGVWGTALFQRLYQAQPPLFFSIMMMPEWYLVIALLAVLAAVGTVWSPLLYMLPLLAAAVGAPIVQAVINAANIPLYSCSFCAWDRLRIHAVTACLHLMQPVARLMGRLSRGLTPLRRRASSDISLPCMRTVRIWKEQWRDPAERVTSVENALRLQGAVIRRGGDFDRHDLEVRGGLFGAVRLRMAIEEHGGGRQMVLIRAWPKVPAAVLFVTILLAVFFGLAFIDHAWIASALLGAFAVMFGARAFGDCSAATSTFLHAVRTE